MKASTLPLLRQALGGVIWGVFFILAPMQVEIFGAVVWVGDRTPWAISVESIVFASMGLVCVRSLIVHRRQTTHALAVCEGLAGVSDGSSPNSAS